MKLKLSFPGILLALLCACLLPMPTEAKQSGYTDPAQYTPKQTTFFLGAPNDTRHRPLLRLYHKGMGGKPARTIRMKPAGNFGWTAVVKGDLKGMFYTFDAVGTKRNPREMPGMYARAVGVNGRRAAIIDMKATNPAGWQEDVRPATASPTDLIIYEMHHRDFSIDESSGLKHKGKYLALTEPRAIAHLLSLGINAVHILPSYDFASVDETKLDRPQYNWGYDPLNYNVPEGSYATDPYRPEVRIREFKQMVQALHKAGIRVILDVVYNHTFDIDGSNFQRTMPDYFYRKNADGTYSDGSGCGNETASEKPLMRQFMTESMKYWIEEYHIDGFRVDLMGVHDIETMNHIRREIDKIDPSIYIYGEGWSAGKCAYPEDKLATKANMKRMPRIGAFSDELRDALRGPFSDDSKGAFLAGIAGLEESIKYGIAGAIAHPQVDMSQVNYTQEPWAEEPTQMISYVSCHDDMCLNDRLKACIPHLTEEELIRLNLLAQTAVFTSQGVPFMLCGEEMFRDKQGVHNSYKSPDAVNRLDWTNRDRYPQVFDYYRGLISLRKRYRAFRLGSAEAVRRNLTFLPTQPCMVGFRLTDEATQSHIYVVLNANKSEQQVRLPKGVYDVLCHDGTIDVEGTKKMTVDDDMGMVKIPAETAIILKTTMRP